jgi:hypothetical protein
MLMPAAQLRLASANQTLDCHPEHLYSPKRDTPADERARIPQELGAPSIRRLFDEWVGYLEPQLIGSSGAEFGRF